MCSDRTNAPLDGAKVWPGGNRPRRTYARGYWFCMALIPPAKASPALLGDRTMATNHASHDTRATPCQESPARRGRDTREGAHEDGRTVTQNNPPTDNRNNAHSGSPAKFLQWLHPETPLEEDTLSEKWSYWYPRDVSEERQPRADPRPTWDNNGSHWGGEK